MQTNVLKMETINDNIKSNNKRGLANRFLTEYKNDTGREWKRNEVNNLYSQQN